MHNIILITVFVASVVNGSPYSFPPTFKFGVATSSYQVEGGWNASGKGENIWDHLTHNHPDWIKDHLNGDVASDSYHRWKEDVLLLRILNVTFYRFSLSWSRILPTGHPNDINYDGIRYYNDLIDELLKYNIEPYVTIFHWDLPQPLQDVGGWPNSMLEIYFEDYANIAFKYFGDRVKTWITINEPIEICLGGYGGGGLAPVISAMGIGEYLCGRTVLLAHARAYHLYDSVYRKNQKGKIGITVDTIWTEPKTNTVADKQAAERSLVMDYAWWVDPIFSKNGDYPVLMKNRVENRSKAENFTRSRLPPFSRDEVKFIKGTADFLGLNHYTTRLISDYEFPLSGSPAHYKDTGVKIDFDLNWKPSLLPWLKVFPLGLRKLLNWIKTRYNNPNVYITENGFPDSGGLDDMERIDYHRQYLNALLDAIHLDKCNVHAYTAWSLLDNFEWRDGYTTKFGLFQVDFHHQNRTRRAKLSAAFYNKIVTTKRIPKMGELFDEIQLSAIKL